MPIPVSCPCGKRFSVPDQYEGKRVKCPGCGQGVKVALGGSPGDVASDSTIGRRSGLASILDEVGAAQAAAENKCPHCKAPMGEEDVICVKCGYNVETGRRLTTQVIAKRDSLAAVLHGGSGPGRTSVPAQIKSAARSLQLLSIYQLCTGLLGIGLFCWVAFSLSGYELVQGAVGMPNFVLALAGGLAFITGVTGFWAASGIVQSRKSAWMTTLILAGIGLFNFPVGTALGLAILPPLMSDEAREYCQA